MTEWNIEIEGARFRRFVKSLTSYEQAVLFASIETVLAHHGIDVCASEWGKTLGGGLYEFRVRASLSSVAAQVNTPNARFREPKQRVLLRVFFTADGERTVLLCGGYNKKKDDSAKRQQREIQQARRTLAAWRARQLS